MSNPLTDGNANSYAKLFSGNLANTCSTDAPESNNGPIAYLNDLHKATPKEYRQHLAEKKSLINKVEEEINNTIDKIVTLEEITKKLLSIEITSHTEIVEINIEGTTIKIYEDEDKNTKILTLTQKITPDVATDETDKKADKTDQKTDPEIYRIHIDTKTKTLIDTTNNLILKSNAFPYIEYHNHKQINDPRRSAFTTEEYKEPKLINNTDESRQSAELAFNTLSSLSIPSAYQPISKLYYQSPITKPKEEGHSTTLDREYYFTTIDNPNSRPPRVINYTKAATYTLKEVHINPTTEYSYNTQEIHPENRALKSLHALKEKIIQEIQKLFLLEPHKSQTEHSARLQSLLTSNTLLSLTFKSADDNWIIYAPHEIRSKYNTTTTTTYNLAHEINALLTQAEVFETGNRRYLEQRRPDIGELMLYPGRLKQPISALTLVIKTLTQHAQNYASQDVHLPEVLSNAGQHAYLPFHHAQEQIKTVLKHRKIPLFDLLQKSDPSYPNFCNDRLRTPELREVMRKASGFSPALQAILLAEKPLRSKGDEWRAWYGFDTSAKAAIEELLDVENYGRRTGLTTEQVLEMLAVSGIDDNASAGFSAVKCSSAYKPTSAPAMEHFHPGATYINTRRETPLTVKDVLDKPGITLAFDRLDYNGLSRMYQMIHLQRELALPFAEVDLLLISILRAQGQTTNWHFTPCTLRALSVFRYLNEAYGVSAEQFAALVLEVSPYSVGERLPMLDRVLDGPGTSQIDKVETTLVLDDREFDPTDGGDGQRRILPALCKAVGLDGQVTLAYLEQIKRALGQSKLTLSLNMLSSLYRLSRLHRLLKRPLHEGIALVALLGASGESLLTQLAGKPVLSDVQGPDMLDLLVALVNLDQWLREENMLPAALLNALTEVPDLSVSLASRLSSASHELEAHLRTALTDNNAISGTPQNDNLKDLTASLLVKVFGIGNSKHALTAQHVPALLRWCEISETELLNDALNAIEKTSNGFNRSLWPRLEHRCELIKSLRLSPGVLQALCDKPEWFELKEEWVPFELDTLAAWVPANVMVATSVNLRFCYQLSRFRTWLDMCGRHGNDESTAMLYLRKHLHSAQRNDVAIASKDLAKLIGWRAREIEVATPHIKIFTDSGVKPLTFDDFLSSLSPAEKAKYDDLGGETMFFRMLTNRRIGHDYYPGLTQQLLDKLLEFLSLTPEPLMLTPQQYDKAYSPEIWEATRKKEESNPSTDYLPVPLGILPDETGVEVCPTWIPIVPSNITHIDRILRLQALCKNTGLPCQTLYDLCALDQYNAYEKFEAVSQLLLANCDDTLREGVEKQMQERWRDALVGYLLAHWAPSNTQLKAAITSADDLTNYFLTDINVSSQVNTTLLNHTIGSLQHYLSRLYSRLEPDCGIATPEAIAYWHNVLGQYRNWKQRQDQLNHAENLIYYKNRPNKSIAFQELEVELNQGKLDTSVLQTAIRNYLTKFERTSNLQVISGYLDGLDPYQGTYHLLGKTNNAPAEYFWRTLDMGLRDDKDRLSPLAWSEWEKISVSATGEIPKSTYSEHSRDAIRPVIIAGRRYVFWVERGSTDLPSGKESNKTLPGTRKFSVHFAFQQSDGTWSPSNELMCLNGYKDGKWQGDEKNDYLKNTDFIPGLIVVVNREGEREHDPWLTVMLYDCECLAENKKDRKSYKDYKINKDYFIEMRDLLLIDRKKLDDTAKEKICKVLLATYIDIQEVQHPYDGAAYMLYVHSGSQLNLMNPKPSPLAPPPVSISAKAPNTNDNPTAFTITRNTDHLDLREYEVLYSNGEKIPASQHSANSIYFEVAIDYIKCDAPHYLIRHLHDKNRETSIYTRSNSWHTDEPWTNKLIHEPNGAQHLQHYNNTTTDPLHRNIQTRLNTVFGTQLVERATESIDRVLSWDTQCLAEPFIGSSDDGVAIKFHGAYGLYFRELFLHLPALVATRLTEQQQFEEAEDWYMRYLFNPYRSTEDDKGRPAPWCTRPLSQAGTSSSTLLKAVDPASRVFVLSRYYQQAVYLSLLENWQLQGDHYYRQLTLSTLNHARLCYQQALALLGPLPQWSKTSRWKPAKLSEVNEEAFRKPINPRVMELRETLESRLYNLRHGLTLDGKKLPALDWSSESLDAFDNGRGGVSNLPIPYRSGEVDIPHYRFRQLLPLAKAAAQQLLDFGRHYMSLMEEEFNTSLSVQLKAQEVKMAEFAIRLQTEAISGVEAKKKVLLLSREKSLAQKDYLSELIEVGRSPEEESATALTWIGNSCRVTSQILSTCSGTVATFTPNIFGVIVGGYEPKGIVQACAEDSQTAGMIADAVAAELKTQADYNRRAAEWEFNKTQTEWDLKILDQQIKETNIELNASTIALAKCKQDKINLEEAYVSMTTGFTIIPIYNWLVARQEHLYGAAYDAVLSLCMGLEAAWRYEIGDYRRASFIDTTAWRDNYKGMLVGESLLVNLQQMENEYLARNERRLTIKKSFSLKKQVDKAAKSDDKKWAALFNTDDKRTAPLSLAFDFKADDFDKSYSGQYLRQLKYVSVTFVLGPGKQMEELGATKQEGNTTLPEPGKKMEELCAILKQEGSTTLLEPDPDAARSFYPGNEDSPEVKNAFKDTRRISRNLHPHQQIALSSTEAEDGLGYEPGTWVYELMFHDGRYLPFEGTGAISQWTLEILGDEALLKDLSVIKDIKFNMVYTAKAGDSGFVSAIANIRAESASGKNNQQGTGEASAQ
ncbi:neuraminidase-like domain-containing protein [Pseudomonas peradeniyensis]|uniref:Tc toxin subunit A-related protein n=1 Tax=Pseudomonas peradeniyensis TaxID=2745488 RepID=UPI0021D4C9AF|nr:neuraminidase-like domain-containing protein [Pseudomonas peradeniyensis]MCU7281226.1 neuraminidase-like domain-containing protein [Pseudomonas peradeniyensis]